MYKGAVAPTGEQMNDRYYIWLKVIAWWAGGLFFATLPTSIFLIFVVSIVYAFVTGLFGWYCAPFMYDRDNGE